MLVACSLVASEPCFGEWSLGFDSRLSFSCLSFEIIESEVSGDSSELNTSVELLAAIKKLCKVARSEQSAE